MGRRSQSASPRKQFTKTTTTRTATNTTTLTATMFVVLSLTSLTVVVTGSQGVPDAQQNSIPATTATTASVISRLPHSGPASPAAGANAVSTTRTVGAKHPATSPPLAVASASTTTPSFPITVVRDGLGGDRQDGESSRPDNEVKRPSNETAEPRDHDDDDDDDNGLRRRRFHLISAAQSWSGGGVRRLSTSRRSSNAGPSVKTRLLYGAIALVVASILTPLVCLAGGFVRTRIARYIERRRRFDKSGEYERVDSVSSVVDSSSLYAADASQSQLDVYIDDPITIEDVTII